MGRDSRLSAHSRANKAIDTASTYLSVGLGSDTGQLGSDTAVHWDSERMGVAGLVEFRKQFRVLSRLGGGSFGSVYLVQERAGPTRLAAKHQRADPRLAR